MKRILFQGDSITDVGRNTSTGSTVSMGQGYALMIAGELGYKEMRKYEFVNRGIGGNRIVDLYARIKADVWNLEPSILSILIGVNDVWHELAAENGVDTERYEHIYRTLVEETVSRFPDIKIMLLEPFVLPGIATEEKWEVFRSEIRQRADIVKERFDEASEKCDPSFWLADGVHPTPAGHRLIADAWLECFETI